jgi:lipid A 4'-phosphatase
MCAASNGRCGLLDKVTCSYAASPRNLADHPSVSNRHIGRSCSQDVRSCRSTGSKPSARAAGVRPPSHICFGARTMMPTNPLRSALPTATWPLRRFSEANATEPGAPGLGPAVTTADRQVARILGCILLSFAVFAIWPEIDLRVSEAFHDPTTGFAIEGNPISEALRLAIWNAAIVACLAAAFGTAIGMAGRALVLPTRAWGFVLTLYILGPGLMVEILTRPLWGRARPAQTAEFGGSFHFSPPNELVEICVRNCSFVSGEVSGATVTAVALVLLRFHLKHRLRKSVSTLLLTAAWCLPPAVALQRVAAGRHFLSDTVFAVLFTLLLALALSVLLRPLSLQMHWSRRNQAAVEANR